MHRGGMSNRGRGGSLGVTMPTDTPITFGNYQRRQKIFKKFMIQKAIDQAPSAKSTLVSPFQIKWPKIKKEVQQEICEKITSVLLPLRPDSRGGRKKRQRELNEAETGDDFTDTELKQKQTEREQRRKEIRSKLVLGINEVTRKLERDELSAIIVCSSAASICPTHHLQVLAATRRCPAMCIREFSKTVGRDSGMNSLLVLGFKKSALDTESLKEVVSIIHRNAVSIEIPWIIHDENETEEADDEGFHGPQPTHNKSPKLKVKQCRDVTHTAISDKPFDIASLYIYKKDSNWLDTGTKMIPQNRGAKPIKALDFIKLDSSVPDVEQTKSKNPYSLAMNASDGQPKRKKMKIGRAGYLPPHVELVAHDENRANRKKKKRKGKK